VGNLVSTSVLAKAYHICTKNRFPNYGCWLKTHRTITHTAGLPSYIKMGVLCKG
jgi:hypothetical protein